MPVTVPVCILIKQLPGTINFTSAISHNFCHLLSAETWLTAVVAVVEAHFLTHAHCLYIIDVEAGRRGGGGRVQNGCHFFRY